MKKILLPLMAYFIGNTLGCSDKPPVNELGSDVSYKGLITNKFALYGEGKIKYTGTEVRSGFGEFVPGFSEIFVVPFDPDWEAGTNWNGDVGVNLKFFKDAIKKDLSELLEGIDSVRTFKGRSAYGLGGEGSTISPQEFVSWAIDNIQIQK